MKNPNRQRLVVFAFGLSLGWTTALIGANPQTAIVDDGNPVHDVIVYGGTSAGVVAAVQVSRMGGDVLLIDPTGATSF